MISHDIMIILYFFILFNICDYSIGFNSFIHSKKSIVFTKAMASSNNNNNIQQLLNDALNKHKLGQIDEAIAAYQLLIVSKSDNSLNDNAIASVHGNLGALFMNKGQYEEARTQFEYAVESNPNNPTNRYNLAVLLTSKLGEHKKALSQCIKVLRLEPKHYKNLHLMGNIFQSLGRPEEAEKYFIQAEEIASEQSSLTAVDQHSTKKSSIMKGLTDYLPLLSLSTGSTQDILINDDLFHLSCLSSHPYIFEVKNLLSSQECDFIVNIASQSHLEHSFVMGGSSDGSSDGKQSKTPYRSSYTTWLSYDAKVDNEASHNISLSAIRDRISSLLNIPVPYLKHHSEELQIVKYETNGEFKVHQDSSSFHSRLITVLIYLSDAIDQSSGSTWFPYSNTNTVTVSDEELPVTVDDAINTALREYESVYEAIDKNPLNNVDDNCSSRSVQDKLRGVSISPRKGKAIIFFNYKAPEFTEIDVLAVHAGLPVTHGEKWIANYWINNDLDSLLESF